MYTQDTSSSDEDDHVARGGSTFYTYGIHYLSGGIAKFYVDHVLRATFTTNVPSVSLPIQLCSATGKHLYVNWVRVRTVQAVEPTVTVGTKYIIEDPYYDSVEYEFDTVATQSNVTESIKDMMADSLITKVLNGFAIGAPIKVTDSVTTESTVSETDPITRDELSDCNLKSCDISKSITDAYMQLSASFADNKVQTENSTVKYYALDSLSVKHLLFWGKVITRSPTEASYYSTVEINAADDSRNLSVQKVPFNDLVISLTGKYDRWSEWIEYLLATEKTGVAAGTIIDRGTPDKQFVFDLKTTRWEAIKKICDYCGLVYNVKLVASGDVYVPTFYALPAADIDQPGGFNLPAPLTFENPADATIVDQPTLQGDPEENYNTVTVVGTITSTGETVIASVWTPAVESGEQKPREYVVTDNSIEEKESTAEIEAIRWLLYLSAPKATLSMKLIKRFDLELFQRIKFGSGFPATIKELTDSVQLPYVVTCDPRAESSTKHHVDVSGVPMSAWFRISEMKYHTEDLQDTCEIKLVTDFIYSTVDPYIEDPYSVYLPPGYFKPVSSDSTGSTQAIVDSTIEKKLSPELSTLISIDEDGQTGNVETESGKIVVLKKLPSGAVCGDEILIIPDGKGNYYGVSPG